MPPNQKSETLKPEMENLRNRFPILIQLILENVDDQSLVTFKETSREMFDFINDERFYWLRILRKYNGSFVEFSKSWRMVIQKNPVEIVREIAVAVEKFFNQGNLLRGNVIWSNVAWSVD